MTQESAQPQLVAELPYVTYARESGSATLRVLLFRSTRNVCPDQHQLRGRCDTTAGFYYGWQPEHAETQLYCPRHFFALHCRSRTLEDLSAEQLHEENLPGT